MQHSLVGIAIDDSHCLGGADTGVAVEVAADDTDSTSESWISTALDAANKFLVAHDPLPGVGFPGADALALPRSVPAYTPPCPSTLGLASMSILPPVAANDHTPILIARMSTSPTSSWARPYNLIPSGNVQPNVHMHAPMNNVHTPWMHNLPGSPPLMPQTTSPAGLQPPLSAWPGFQPPSPTPAPGLMGPLPGSALDFFHNSLLVGSW
jgi:hypothetical protein